MQSLILRMEKTEPPMTPAPTGTHCTSPVATAEYCAMDVTGVVPAMEKSPATNKRAPKAASARTTPLIARMPVHSARAGSHRARFSTATPPAMVKSPPTKTPTSLAAMLHTSRDTSPVPRGVHAEPSNCAMLLARTSPTVENRPATYRRSPTAAAHVTTPMSGWLPTRLQRVPSHDASPPVRIPGDDVSPSGYTWRKAPATTSPPMNGSSA
mmetsp:Transcript_21071/g.50816  ORF Transcript_21071/g.50816 Transcript_21071/m.50816 type:complete len:211 (-) Transcript_21071:4447-5079(-)